VGTGHHVSSMQQMRPFGTIRSRLLQRVLPRDGRRYFVPQSARKRAGRTMTMQFTLQVPSRTVTYKATWCRLEWQEMDDRYREIRSRSRNPMTACFWCKRKFENGDMMALAHFENKGNKTLCQTCAKELIATDSSPASGQE
jgi:uncharacterized CHY-type Zn-finger protein